MPDDPKATPEAVAALYDKCRDGAPQGEPFKRSTLLERKTQILGLALLSANDRRFQRTLATSTIPGATLTPNEMLSMLYTELVYR